MSVSVIHFYHSLSYTHLVASDSLVVSHALHINETGLLVMKFVLETTKFQESSWNILPDPFNDIFILCIIFTYLDSFILMPIISSNPKQLSHSFITYPQWNRILTILTQFFRSEAATKWRAVWPWSSTALTSLPCLIRNSAMLNLSWSSARSRGVLPVMSRQFNRAPKFENKIVN